MPIGIGVPVAGLPVFIPQSGTASADPVIISKAINNRPLSAMERVMISSLGPLLGRLYRVCCCKTRVLGKRARVLPVRQDRKPSAGERRIKN